jgi:hypothetical protein
VDTDLFHSFDILQLLEGLLAALGNHAAYDVLNASETNHRNAWNKAFFEFYDRVMGAAKDYEMPLGKRCIKNFKTKVVDEIWPLLDSIAKEKTKEIVHDDTLEPDEYDEIPLDKYLKVAIEQYATYNAIKASHEEAIQQAKKERAELKASMHEAEENYHAIPPGVVLEGHTPHYSSLTLDAPYTDNEEDDEDNDDYVPANATGKTSDASSLNCTKIHPKKSCEKKPHNKKPPPAGDANLSKSPFEDLNHYQEQIMSSMKRMKEELFSNGSDDIEEKKQEKRLKLLYTSEDHHRRMGDMQRADEIKAEINKIEKDVLGI